MGVSHLELCGKVAVGLLALSRFSSSLAKRERERERDVWVLAISPGIVTVRL